MKSTNLFHLAIKTVVVAEVVLNALVEHFCEATSSSDDVWNRLADSLHGVHDHWMALIFLPLQKSIFEILGSFNKLLVLINA